MASLSCRELLATSADSRALANPDVHPAIERLSAYRGERGSRVYGGRRA